MRPKYESFVVREQYYLVAHGHDTKPNASPRQILPEPVKTKLHFSHLGTFVPRRYTGILPKNIWEQTGFGMRRDIWNRSSSYKGPSMYRRVGKHLLVRLNHTSQL